MIICSYPNAQGINKERKFDAAKEMWSTLKSYANILDIDVSQFSPRESNYDFLPVVFAFYLPKYSAYTNSAQFQIKKRNNDGYEPHDPPNLPFVVLDEELLGSDLSKKDWSFVTT